jgi:uncharacterized protein YbjT (DUF2867 family)/AraC-like DNA-binding protein
MLAETKEVARRRLRGQRSRRSDVSSQTDASLGKLAELACLSPRQFTRVFRAETGLSPAKAIENLRLEAARFMLEQGRLSVEEIARATGFGDRERMRRSFLRTLGQTLQKHPQRFAPPCRYFLSSDAMESALAALSFYVLGYAIVPQSNSSRGNEMTTQSSHANPILVTGAAGAVGSIGRHVTEMLFAKGRKVRALVRREDERAEALRQLGAEVMQGDLTDLTAMHRAIEGCARVYFAMSVSVDYLTATVNTAAVARHHGVEAFVNMSQMTVTQMSITESTYSPQHKQHWLAEQALSWSGLPVVTMRPTVFLDGFFRLFAAPGVRDADELALPMGSAKTSPISAVDVARAVSVVLEDPTPHLGQIYNLTGFESADLEHYARVFSEALGRPIRYRDVPLAGWSQKLLQAGVPAHVVNHLSVMTELNKQGRYDRMTDDLFKLTGQKPISMYDFVKLHAAEFTRS